MRNGKFNTVLIIAAILVFVLACNLGAPAAAPTAPQVIEGNTPSPQSQPATASLCDNELYPVRAGASWTYASTGSPTGDFAYTDIITDVRGNMQISAEFQGMQVPVSFNTSSVVWYASGVGFVKSIENSDFGDTPYTATTELQSYSIP